MQSGRFAPAFWNNLCCLCLWYPTLKMEAANSSGAVWPVYHIMRHHITENGNLHSHSHTKLPSFYTKTYTRSYDYPCHKSYRCCYNYHGYTCLNNVTHVPVVPMVMWMHYYCFALQIFSIFFISNEVPVMVQNFHIIKKKDILYCYGSEDGRNTG